MAKSGFSPNDQSSKNSDFSLKLTSYSAQMKSLTPIDFDCLMESFVETIVRSTSYCHSKPAFEELGR